MARSSEVRSSEVRSTGFNGTALALAGEALEVGAKMPEFSLIGNDMKPITRSDFAGKVLVVLSVPSLDTPVCSVETKRFNSEAAAFKGAAVFLTVSRDLPFAQKRWCAAESAQNVITASDYKFRSFGTSFGVDIPEWGLLSRAAFIADSQGVLRYVEYVPEIPSEPKYEEILAAVRTIR